MSGHGFWSRSAFPGWGLSCVCLVWGFACTPLFFWLGCWGVWALACAASVSRHLLAGLPVAWGCPGVAAGGVCPPPSPFVFFRAAGGGGVDFGPVVVWLCGVRRCLSPSWVSWSPPTLPLSFGLRPCFFFSCPPLLQWGVCRRVRGLLNSWASVRGGSQIKPQSIPCTLL